MSKLGLLRAGFSAILGREVVLKEGRATCSIHDVFKQTYVMKPPGFRPPSPKPVYETSPICFFGFEDTLTLQPRSNIYVAPRLKGGGGPLTVSTDELAPEFDYDFTYAKDDGKQYMRGGFVYQRPYGWKREWPVSYHGMDMSSAENIVKEGYKAGPGAKYGPGIYTSPSLEMVRRRYANPFDHDGKRHKIAFQNRVNPDRNGHLKIISASQTEVGADYWLSPNEDDVRPYGLLVREVRRTMSRPES